MQFVKNGPDVPDRLLQAHEDGNVVFFCGAGISYPAKLPGFSGLVSSIYDNKGELPSTIEKSAIDNGQFDTAISLLETRIGRESVRNELEYILSPDYSLSKAKQTHESLLTLSKNRDGLTKLVTTNFDRIFEDVIKASSLNIERFSAPLLPVPKNRWNGLVYLHGLLSEPVNYTNLDHLILSSGDFGIAYLTERWAARFVTELFRNYTICFVGYSINDPVLRYMMDALAADSLRGEDAIEAYAFGNFKKGEEDKQKIEWSAKNVTPILYKNHSKHYYLHETLKEWAGLFNNGSLGKQRIISQYAITRPVTSTKQDDFVGRTLWAISDPSGLPAKRFAYFNPLPSIDWLDVFSSNRFRHDDLVRFKVQPDTNKDEKLEYSLINRPTSYKLSPRMSVVYPPNPLANMTDNVMDHLSCWLSRHLNSPKLMLWIYNNGGKLSDSFIWCLNRQLSKKRYPDSVMAIWQIILAGRLNDRSNMDLYQWKDNFTKYGLTPAMRMKLQQLLSPCIDIRKPFRDSGLDMDKIPMDHKQVSDFIGWEVVLVSEYPHSFFSDLKNNETWQQALPDLLSLFVALLRDALDLMMQLGGINEVSDFSYIVHPSIAEHDQNRGYNEWTVLIDLVRDSWMAVSNKDPIYAKLEVLRWSNIKYPLFRRLQIFALSHNDLFTGEQVLNILHSDDDWWLWSSESEHEILKSLESLANIFNNKQRLEFEETILKGPPRNLFKDGIEPEQLKSQVDKDIWLRLVTYKASGVKLSVQAETKIQDVQKKYPELIKTIEEKDAFPVWMGESEGFERYTKTPLRLKELIKWIRTNSSSTVHETDDWRERCMHDFRRSICSLVYLANHNEWYPNRWRVALQAWSDEKFLQKSWVYLKSILDNMPIDIIYQIASTLGSWLMDIAKEISKDDEIFLRINEKVIDCYRNKDLEPNEDVVFRAINNPVGHSVQAVIRWWYKRDLEDGQHLPESLKIILKKVADTDVDVYRNGRVILSANIITLFRVDPDWTRENLLQLFDWRLSNLEAQSAWEGFLWSPRLFRPLIEELKIAFLDTASHYIEIGNHGSQYAALLTYAALDRGDTFTRKELTKSVHSLPSNGLEQVTKSLVSALESAGDQAEEYWDNHVVQFVKYVYPKSLELVTPIISRYFAELCVASRSRFPDSLKLTKLWIKQKSFSRTDDVLRKLHRANLCSQFPDDVLEFLDIVVSDAVLWPPKDLHACLESLSISNHEIIVDKRYQRLDEFSKRREAD